MANSILTPEMEKWLFDNFKNRSNEQLAEELSVMLRKKYAEELNEIVRKLPDVTHPGTKKKMLARINRIENFRGLSGTSVRMIAKRIGCPKKSKVYISKVNEKKAKLTNNKKWLAKAQTVENIDHYLNDMQLGETRYVKITDSRVLRMIKQSISEYNEAYGKKHGMFITFRFVREIGVMRLEASKTNATTK